MRFTAATFLIAISCSHPVMGQDRSLEKSIVRELSVLGSFVELDDGVSDKIFGDLRDVVRKESDEYDGTTFLFGHIPPTVLSALLKSADKRGPSPVGMDAYNADLNARRKFHRKVSAIALMLMIDRASGVQQNQWDRLFKEVN